MKNNEDRLITDNWTRNAFAEEEAREIKQQHLYTRPFEQFFLYLSLIIFVLFVLYDSLIISYQTFGSILYHYLPGFILYLLLLIYFHLNKKSVINFLHVAVSLLIILPLLHLSTTVPESISANYFFIAIILTTLYYIVPGKQTTTALFLAILLCLSQFLTLFYSYGKLDAPQILNLLFYILINLAGLMITYIMHNLLQRISRISANLEEKSSRLERMREEFIKTLSGLELGVLLLDGEGKIIINNESFCNLTGLGSLNSGENLLELADREKGYINKFYWQKVSKREQLGEEIGVSISGIDKWLYLKGLALSGEILENLYLLIIEDITELKKNKFAQDQRERHLQTILNPRSNIVLYERQGKSLYFSENVLHLTGYTREELCHRKPCYEHLVEEKDRNILRTKYRRWLEEGRNGILYLWYRIHCRNEEVIWIEERMSLLLGDNGEEIITGILIDNSDLKRTEQELKRSELSLSKAQEIAHLGSWDLNVKKKEFRMSEELYRLMGLVSGSESNWQNFLEYVHPEELKEVSRRIRQSFENSEKTLSLELRIIDANEEEKTVLSETELVWENRDLKGVRGTVMDITERKELERQLFQNQKMEAIGTLAGGIAHDFNNILNIIMGYSTVIEDMLPNESELWYKFDRIVAAARRAKNLVSHILTISRQHTPTRESIYVQDLMKQQLEMLRAAIPSIIEFKTDLRSESRIFGDPNQLEQVIMNLCTNAYYAMKPKGGKLYIRLFDVKDNICLEIEDTGSGIPSRVIEKIFDPYFTTKPKGEGTGLGLAIVKGIVEELGGRIMVNSEKDKGSRFRILIPRHKEDEDDLSVTGEPAEKEILSDKEGIRVMFIDDEADLLELFITYLEANKMVVSGFDDGHRALKAFEENPLNWDIIITDISLPGIDGLEVVKRVREQNTEVPVIVYSGFMRPEFDTLIKELSVSKLLIKPVFPEAMVKEIRKIVSEEKEVDE